MYGVVAEVRVPVTVPNVEVAHYNNRIFQIDNSLTQKVQGSLIAVKIYVNNEVGIMVRVEGQDIDISMVDNVEAQSKSKF